MWLRVRVEMRCGIGSELRGGGEPHHGEDEAEGNDDDAGSDGDEEGGFDESDDGGEEPIDAVVEGVGNRDKHGVEIVGLFGDGDHLVDVVGEEA